MSIEGAVEFCLDVVYIIYDNPYLLTIACFIAIIFSLPTVFFIVVYVTSLFIGIHGYINGLKDPSPANRTWDKTRRMVLMGWRRFGRVWHGYEIEGEDNIPTEGSALFVSYHSTASYDLYFLCADVYIFRNRLIRMVAENILYKIPGMNYLHKAFGSVPGPVSACVDILNEGDLFLITPGGAYETLYGSSEYKLMWKNRIGYAKVAIQAKASIVQRSVEPVLKIPLTPIFGGFPVKLKTIIGKPIPYDPNITAEELAAKTKLALENLIKEHQRLPGSIFHAICDRVLCSPIKKDA